MYERNEKKHVDAMNACKAKWKINVYEKYVSWVCDMNMYVYEYMWCEKCLCV